MPDEALPGEAALRQQMGRGKLHDMVGDGLVNGRAADLDHLEPRRSFEHPVADLRRLQHAIAGLEQEGLPLVLIDEARPALAAIDHLEADLVEMDIVGDRPAVGDADMRGDEAPAEAARDQIAILHAGAPLATGRSTRHAGEHEFLPALRQCQGRVGVDQLDPRPARGDHLVRRAGGQCRSVAEQAKHQRSLGFAARPRFEPQGQAMS